MAITTIRGCAQSSVDDDIECDYVPLPVATHTHTHITTVWLEANEFPLFPGVRSAQLTLFCAAYAKYAFVLHRCWPVVWAAAGRDDFFKLTRNVSERPTPGGKTGGRDNVTCRD